MLEGAFHMDSNVYKFRDLAEVDHVSQETDQAFQTCVRNELIIVHIKNVLSLK